ncbi:MAG: hypothetical protein E4H01_08300 [Lysobacterales bacterium]|nr:MAG: hypothetical protein E4H01_08300 [Xanthomonadales bacterium]
MKVRIFTVAYAKHAAWWMKYAMRALGWPANRAALAEHDVTIDMYAEDSFKPMVSALAAERGYGLEWHTIKPRPGLNGCTHDALSAAVNEGAVLLPVPGDLIFGDGSIASLLRMLESGKNRAIAVSHVRVDPSKFEPLFTGATLSNAELVSLAIKTMNDQQMACKLPQGKDRTWMTGISWGEVGPNLYSATYHLPSICAIVPLREDVTWYEKNPKSLGAWDHEFPSTLIEPDRYRLIGSSDAAFAVELSLKTMPKSGYGTHEVDEYRRRLPHNLASKSTLCIWRAAA